MKTSAVQRITLKNHKASLTPSFVIIVMMLMITGSYFYSLMVVYENRLIVRDSVDAAITSALAGGAVEKSRATHYYEDYVCIRSHIDIDSDGTPHEKCDEWGWVPLENREHNYLYLSKSEGERIGRQYLEENLRRNLDKKEFTIKNFHMEATYDEERYIEASCKRTNTSRPSSWWSSEFGDSDPPSFDNVSTRIIRFPRWVKVQIRATVEIKVPLTKLLGDDGKMEFTWTGDAVKELKEVD